MDLQQCSESEEFIPWSRKHTTSGKVMGRIDNIADTTTVLRLVVIKLFLVVTNSIYQLFSSMKGSY